MLVPAAFIKLDEAHAALSQPARQQAIRGVGAGLARIRSVQVEDALRLFRQIHQLRHRRLHAIRHLVLRDARLNFGIAVRLGVHLVQLRDSVEHAPARGFVDAGRVGQIQHRIARGAEVHALIFRRQKSAAPQAREQRLVRIDGARLRDQHHERRQILVLAAQPIADPRPHAGPSRLLAAGLDERDRRIVIDRLGVGRLDDGDVVDDLGVMRQQLAEPGAGLAVLREVEERLGDRQRRLARGHAGDALALPDRIRKLGALHASQASACNRTVRSATARPIDADR